MGRELNPRWGSFDWKEFCELRPGLIGWMLLNAAMMLKQYERLGYVTGSMILVNVFQGLYVWDAQYQERAILTTMDITTDGVGFMLVFGDLAWVPFTYSIQARYLVDHDPMLGLPALAAIVGVNVCGYLIFRGANGQKDAFRRDPKSPSLAHLTFLQTKRGTKAADERMVGHGAQNQLHGRLDHGPELVHVVWLRQHRAVLLRNLLCDIAGAPVDKGRSHVCSKVRR